MVIDAPKVWDISLNDPWFDAVRSGEKIFEGRCHWKKAREYQVGDFLTIRHHTNPNVSSFTAKIVEKIIFKSFQEALENLPIAQVLPGVTSVAKGVEIYKQYVSLPTQAREGVCMIKIQVCKI